MTTNARDEKWSEWIEWNGGECPLSEGVTHQVRHRDGDILDDDDPETWDWSNHGYEGDIIAYRYKIKEPESMEVTEAEEEAWQAKERELNHQKYSPYFKDVSRLDKIDVYRVVSLFDCEKHGHAISHAVKKLLLTGVRTGGKDVETEVREAIDSLNRWIEMREEDK